VIFNTSKRKARQRQHVLNHCPDSAKRYGRDAGQQEEPRRAVHSSARVLVVIAPK
jgi:hypothetical protein